MVVIGLCGVKISSGMLLRIGGVLVNNTLRYMQMRGSCSQCQPYMYMQDVIIIMLPTIDHPRTCSLQYPIFDELSYCTTKPCMCDTIGTYLGAMWCHWKGAQLPGSFREMLLL